MNLPDFLQKAIINNTTSLGEHPAFPPEDEDIFISHIINNRYSEVMKNVETNNTKELTNKLNQLITKCKEIESECKEALEILCSKICNTIFTIPEDTINIEVHLVTECDMSRYRMIPEPIDITFDDIEQMNEISEYIYKRRMINALIAGISNYYVENMKYYIQDLYEINPQLPHIYSEIFKYNNALLFNQPDTIKIIENMNSGKVDVNIGNEMDVIEINAEGVIFPVLLEYTIRGILEVASLHGLPQKQDLCEYVMSKADYRLAENWDIRLGVPLWNILLSIIKENDIDINEIGVNFLLMQICKLDNENFNYYLQNAFKKTKTGSKLTLQMVHEIIHNKERDDFEKFIDTKNQKLTINDQYYTPDELLAEIEE